MQNSKEWLNTETLEYKQAHTKPDGDWLEIPEGMNLAYKDDMYTHFTKLEMGYRDAELIWQRATHPEELPFIDDEPKSINDQYAEIEEVRQQTIESTLSQRQSQYGCYEDVAHVTQQILSALRIGNYDKLPAPMKESLHMIASKMARIVNGDPEYLDNWHDIGGYSKLIEKLIKGE